MAKSAAQDEHKAQIVLSIDIGGSHVKVLTSAGGVEHKVVSGTAMTAEAMVAAVRTMIWPARTRTARTRAPLGISPSSESASSRRPSSSTSPEGRNGVNARPY